MGGCLRQLWLRRNHYLFIAPSSCLVAVRLYGIWPRQAFGSIGHWTSRLRSGEHRTFDCAAYKRHRPGDATRVSDASDNARTLAKAIMAKEKASFIAILKVRST